MVYEVLMIFISLTAILSPTKTCENFASISVKENLQYPSGNLLDVASLLQAKSNNEKDSIYLTDLISSKPFILINGILSISGQLDREEICKNIKPNILSCCNSVCCMYIGVTTSKGKTLYIKVNIEDENDNEPTFPQQSIKLQIHENVELGYNLVIPKAVDLDSTNYGIDRYDLVQDKNCGECFQIKSESRDGGPILLIKTTIDRELNKNFNLIVLALDKGFPPKTGSLSVAIEVIDVNDNKPQFEEPSLLISEEENGKSGREIRKIRVTDEDTGANSQISYSIEDFTLNAQKYFRLYTVRDGVSLLLQSTLDYETINHFPFKIVAKDHGSPSLSSTLNINVYVMNVNDEPPEITFYQRGLALDPNNIILNFPENSTRQQNLILIHVTDKDSKLSDINCEVSYPKDTFYLDENQQTNLIENKKIFDLKNSVIFDRETVSLYRVNIMCSDSSSMLKLTSSAEIQLRITDINDNAPLFSSSFYFGKITETNILDNIVDINNGVIKVTDADTDRNSRINFSLADIDNSTDSHKFSIATHFAQIKNIAPIDFEEKQRYIFLIIAKDCGNPVFSTSATITINVLDANDNKPEISQKFYSFSVLEEEPIGTEIGRIEATDLDFSPGNKDFIFDIISQDVSRSNFHPNKLFFIENNSGRIKTKVALDHEKDQNINFLVKVRNTNDDSNSRQRLESNGSPVPVQVKIIDINDNSPKLIKKSNQISDSAQNNEHLTISTIYINNDFQSTSNPCSVFPYTFNDADYGINAEVRVTLRSNPHFHFEMGHNLICPNTSNLAPGPYTVYVIGEDRNGGNGSKRSEYPINIIVKTTISNKQTSSQKFPRQDQDENISDYRALIIFIVLIATIIVFCFLLILVVVKTKLCIPRNMSPSSRNREKVEEKQSSDGTNKNYNIIMPGGSCDNKRLRSSLNNQNIINTDYSNNLFYPGTLSHSMDILNSQYPKECMLDQSNEFMFSGNDGSIKLQGTMNQIKNNDLRYEQLQRNTGSNLSRNTTNWDNSRNLQYNYLLEPRDSTSLSSNCDKNSQIKQDIIAVAGGYQKSINDVYLQTSFV